MKESDRESIAKIPISATTERRLHAMAETGFYSRNADIVAFFVKQARKHDHV
jgi:hypothetical protein